ncbi:unnamed protein product [Closterium sp. Naga37s-1]|nr:unnamed protein product [Closterium sp. Naga37s-1]
MGGTEEGDTGEGDTEELMLRGVSEAEGAGEEEVLGEDGEGRNERLYNEDMCKWPDKLRLAPGLYLVGTPIGNLEDVTIRALRVLRCADLILAEDTRRSVKLLRFYGITTPMMSYHAFNATARREALIGRMRSGQSLALVSDAGMPGVSDPGADLVAACAESAVPVSVIPGPSAATTAVAAAGFLTNGFTFCAFRKCSLNSNPLLARHSCLSSPILSSPLLSFSATYGSGVPPGAIGSEAASTAGSSGGGGDAGGVCGAAQAALRVPIVNPPFFPSAPLPMPVPSPSHPPRPSPLSASPRPTVGFLSERSAVRQRRLKEAAEGEAMQVLFVAPHKLLSSLSHCIHAFGPDRPCLVARELTKLHEELWRGTLSEALAEFTARGPKGEFTLVIDGLPRKDLEASQQTGEEEVTAYLEKLIHDGTPPSQVSSQAVH